MKVGKLLSYAILAVGAAFFIFPIVVVVTNSIMSSFEVFNRYSREITPANALAIHSTIHFVEMSIIPRQVTLRQYAQLFLERPVYLLMFLNSVKLTVPIVIGQVMIATPAAYVFEYSKVKGKEIIFLSYIVIMLLPMQVTLVPNFIAANMIGLQDSPWAIILPAIFSPFGVFLIRQFIKGMPYEYIEAAKMDGASNSIIFARIILPLIKPAVSALVILSFIEHWNIVDQAVIFIKNIYDEPLSVYLSTIISEDTGMVFATSCFYMFPTILVFLFGQEYMVEGIQLSGIK